MMPDPFNENNCIKDFRVLMINTLKYEPIWTFYNINNDVTGSTKIIEKYWTDSNLGGGTLTSPISTSSTEQIKTPLMGDI